ncbi:MAG: hypothetical protein K5697_02485 [Lachnospiraceae bacterium]|nr:hypothetical protein [Lachnospiraceae bacterium]
MMNVIRTAGTLILWFGIFPLFAGMLPAQLIRKEKKNVAELYLCGLVLCFAVFQCSATAVLVISRRLSALLLCANLILALLSLAGLFLFIFQRKKGPVFEGLRLKEKKKRELLFWGAFFLLLAYQLFMSDRYMTSDGDDAYYLGHALLADRTDLMYVYGPYTGYESGTDYRHMLSPFPMFIAMLARMSGLHTAIVAHSILPLILIPLAYLVYARIGVRLFEGERRERLPVFLCCLALFTIWGNTTVYTRETFFLTRTWQGKAVLAALMLPLCLLILMHIAEKAQEGKEKLKGWFVLLLLVNLSGALCSSMALFLMPVMEGILLLVTSLRSRKPKLLLWGLLCVLPDIAFLAVYTFYFGWFKLLDGFYHG